MTANPETQSTGTPPTGTLPTGPSPTVSAILVSWNRCGLLEAAIDSLRAQNYPALNVVVVDNGSTDGSAEWLESQSDVTLVRNTENVGAAAARNHGYAKATGKYLLFMDSDEELRTPGGLQRLVDRLERDAEVSAISGIYFSDENLETLWCWSPCMDWEGSHDAEASARPKENPPTLSTCLQLVRKDCFERTGGFDEYFFYLYDDADLSENLIKLGTRLAVDPEVKVFHHFAYEGRIDRDPLDHHYYYENLRLRFVVKHYGMGCFLRSCAWRLLRPRHWLKQYVYMKPWHLYDIYLLRASRHVVTYFQIRNSRGERWV